MSFDSIKFGKVLWEDQNFTLCEVHTNIVDTSYVALVPTCLKLKKIIPSIPTTIRSFTEKISDSLNQDGFFCKIIESGITPDNNPFLVIKKPHGEAVGQYAFVSEEEYLRMLRQLAHTLLQLHANGIYQREISPHFDLFFDGEKIHLAFPAARDIFHKAYTGAGSNATVYDIPRFVILAGSVHEDAVATVQLGLAVLERNKDIRELDPRGVVRSYLEDLKVKLATRKDSGDEVLRELLHLTAVPESKTIDSHFPGFESSDDIQTHLHHSKLEHVRKSETVKVAPLINSVPVFSILGQCKRMFFKIPTRYKNIFVISGVITFLCIFFLSFFGKKSEAPSQLTREHFNLKNEQRLEPVPEPAKVGQDHSKVVPDQIEVDAIAQNDPLDNDSEHNAGSGQDESVPLLDPEWSEHEDLLRLAGESGGDSLPSAPVMQPRDGVGKQPTENNIDDKYNSKVSQLRGTISAIPDSGSNSEIKMLTKSTNFEERIKAIKLLEKKCKTMKERSTPYLEYLLSDADILVRGFAVHAYASCEGPGGKPKLLERYKLEESSVVKRAIEKALNGL